MRGTMRGRRAAAIAASAAIMLTACGGGDSGGGGGQPSVAALEGVGPITFATGKDTSGNLKNQVAEWNKLHPDQKVTVSELPEEADGQRQQMVGRAQARSEAYSVLNLDVVWTAEFAANGWVVPLPEAEFDLAKMLPTTVDTAKYFNKLYGVPVTSDGGLLYYRKDLLAKAGVTTPPKTWDELKAACTKIQALPEAKSMRCYAGQHEKYEGLTVNFSEAVNSAGGVVFGDDGKPNVDTEQALRGLEHLATWYKDGTIPKEAIGFKEEESRRAFEGGKLIFMRNWPYAYAKGNESGLKGKFEVAPLPGASGPGVSTLGGHNYAVSAFTPNKKTAADFIKFMSSLERQKANVLATSQAPTIASLYDDPALLQKFPYLGPLKKSIETAKSRPKVVKYGDVTAAIQGAAYNAMQGKTPPKQALTKLQEDLSKLIQ